jgi:hypothetical protein
MKTKFLILLLITATIFSACQNEGKESENSTGEELNTDIVDNPETASGEADQASMPAFEFEEEVIDFGEISQGEKVKRRFRFKNVGESNLIISDARGSCGCTVPLWPKQPIKPGQEGEIEVVFDSNGKKGKQHKTITLVANTQPNTKVIAIKGNVLTPDNQQ